MPNRITKMELITLTLSAIIETHHTYLQWSGNEGLSNAPEYLLTVKIAEKIASIDKPKFVTLEDNVQKTLKLANAKGQGNFSSDIRLNGRFDIVIWWAKGDPRAVIEVKHRVYTFADIEDDIKRICETLQRKKSTSSIKCGLIAFYMSTNYKDDAKNQLKKQIDNIFTHAKSTTERYKKLVINKTTSINSCDDKDVYSAIVFDIRR